jgi:BMFP domain-containing protein YqiC
MIHAIGFNRLSDEEYLAQLREKRAAYLQRIANLEAQLEEEKNAKRP